MSWKDEELEDEMRTYYSREAKGMTDCGEESALGTRLHHQRGTFGDGVNDGERRLQRDGEKGGD